MWTLAAIPFIGFLLIAGLMTLLMIHRQIPAIAREVGRWFAPCEGRTTESRSKISREGAGQCFRITQPNLMPRRQGPSQL